MSSEAHKYNIKTFNKQENVFDANIINFPNDRKIYDTKNLTKEIHTIWKITDKANQDQLKAIIGICFMLAALTLMGLYSNLF